MIDSDMVGPSRVMNLHRQRHSALGGGDDLLLPHLPSYFEMVFSYSARIEIAKMSYEIAFKALR